MLSLCLFLLCTLAASGAEPGPSSTELSCDKRLDVVSYFEWQILSKFSRELTDNAVLVNVDTDGYNRGTYNRAVLHDWRKKTYIYEVYPYYDTSSSGPDRIRELVEISGLSVKDIKFGRGFLIILTEDGSVWTAGRNQYGQLSGDTYDRKAFTRVQGVPAVSQIAASFQHCTVLTQDGRLFSWGYGSPVFGVLGYIPDSIDSNPTPTSFSLGEGAPLSTSMCCGASACMALTEDAEVFTWGLSSRIGRSGDNRVPGRVEGIPQGERITKLACGSNHMVALASSGRLYGWGWNGHGDLLQAPNEGTSATDLDLGGKVIRDVVAGELITIARTDAGDIYYFGYYDGQANTKMTQLEGGLYPRDLMAKSFNDWLQTIGAVSLGCK